MASLKFQDLCRFQENASVAKVDCIEFVRFANCKLRENCTVILFCSWETVDLNSNCLIGKRIMSVKGFQSQIYILIIVMESFLN